MRAQLSAARRQTRSRRFARSAISPPRRRIADGVPSYRYGASRYSCCSRTLRERHRKRNHLMSDVKGRGRKFAMARTPSLTREPPAHRRAGGVLSRNSRSSTDGNDGGGFDGRRLGLVGDQLAQERNQYYERDADREAAGTKLREELRVARVGGDGRGAGRLGDHSRKIAGEKGGEAGHEHPAAHHHALILLRRELADHGVSDRHDEQFTDALQHVAHEEPRERAIAIRAGQLDAER